MPDDKKEEKKEEPKAEWTPDQPIPDEDGETEAQRRHMLSRRLKYLDDPDSYKKPKEKKGDPKAEPKKDNVWRIA